MSLRLITEKRFEEILSNISNYLQRISINQNAELEKEYYTFIEQDAEKLLNLNNYGIINLELFERIKIIFKMLIEYLEDEKQRQKMSYFIHIINDLYFIFKYVFENIIFMIENEFLVQENHR